MASSNSTLPALHKANMNGVLSIPASATQKPSSSSSSQKATSAKLPSSSKASTLRLKLVVRRLPPGLTQAEFEHVLGDDWKVGGGNIDWISYKEGKISKDLSKPSRPSRVYLRVTAQPKVSLLSDIIRQASFQDSKNSSKDPVLIGLPLLEYAQYGRVPGGRVRKDGRQGTIDQDPEFKDFLESLTNPVVKASAGEDPEGEKKDEKVTITPLVQFLKEKKANKAKESSQSTKASRHGRQDPKDSKQEKAQLQNKKVLSRSDRESTTDKKSGKESKAEKATKEAVKILNKQAASMSSKTTDKVSAPPTTKETPPSQVPERKRERPSASAAAKILQRDLGILPSGGSRRRQKPTSPDTTKATLTTPTPSATSQPELTPATTAKPTLQVPPSPTAPTKSSPATAPTGPRHGPLQIQKQAAKPPPGAPSPKQPKAPPAPSVSATQAFLKHANPSQGITEILLEEAFSVFGKLSKVEIDKKKGFGYLDFEEPEGLQKAMQASPIKIAQGQVVVLERKERPSTTARNVRGGTTSTSTRGGTAGQAAAPAEPAQPAQVPTSPAAPAAGRPPQGPATRPPQGPRGRGGRHRGGFGRGGGHANSNSGNQASSPSAGNADSTTSPATNTAPADLDS